MPYRLPGRTSPFHLKCLPLKIALQIGPQDALDLYSTKSVLSLSAIRSAERTRRDFTRLISPKN